MSKKTILRVASMLLASVMLVGATGCHKGEEESTETAVSTEADDGYLDNLPEGLDFGGTEVIFLVAEPSANKGGAFSERSIGLEDYTLGAENTNKVDEVIYYRNTDVESRLNVDIVTYAFDGAIIQNAVLNSLLSGDSEFDVLCGYQAFDISIATQGLVLNLNDLESHNADYIDFSREYWSQSYNEAMSYSGAMYWITGDLSLRYIGGMYCTFVNTVLYNNAFYNTRGDIYSLVDSGKWTLETMSQMSVAVFEDSGTKADSSDEQDILGFTLERNDMLDGMAVGAGVLFSEKGSDGEISIILSNGDRNAAAIDFINKMNKILFTDRGTYYVTPHTHSQTSMTLFAKGNVLFTHDKVYQAENYLTDMKEDYAIIPSPKLDSNQENYRAAIHDGCTLFGIYYNSDNIAASAASLEAMAALSYQNVTPSYYEEALKYRYSRDGESARMLDLIRDSVYIDFAFAWGNNINSIHNYFRDAVSTTATASSFRKFKNTWNASLSTLLDTLKKAS